MSKLIQNTLLIVIVFAFSVFSANAQTSILPINSYGVWDRSASFNISIDTAYNYLHGIEANVSWKNIQPSDSGHYDWSSIQAIIQNAYDNNQWANFFCLRRRVFLKLVIYRHSNNCNDTLF